MIETIIIPAAVLVLCVAFIIAAFGWLIAAKVIGAAFACGLGAHALMVLWQNLSGSDDDDDPGGYPPYAGHVGEMPNLH